jgi:DNA-directed RNA polymerase subunit beta'
MRYVTSAKGEKIVISRSGEVLITDDMAASASVTKVPYGATLRSTMVRPSRRVLSWLPGIRTPVRSLPNTAGTVRFENVEEGVTVAKQIDDVTGLSTLVVIDPKRGGKAQTKGLRPQVKLLDESG